MTREEYLQTVTDQIRTVQARKAVAAELQAHIEDQAEDFMTEGISREEAQEKAVLEMGDPVEVGTQLDRIHRPKPAISLLVLVLVLLGVSVLTIYRLTLIPGLTQSQTILPMHILSVLLSLAFVLFAYRMDYSALGRYAVPITVGYFVLMAFVLLRQMFFGTDATWIITPARTLSFSMIGIMFLFIPVYGALLFHLRRGKIQAVLLSFALAFFASIPALYMSMHTLSTAFILFTSMMIMLTYALSQGWFQVSPRLAITLIWSVVAALFAAAVLSLALSAGYRTQRLIAWWTMGSDYDTTINYMPRSIQSILQASRLIGSSEPAVQIVQDRLPEALTDNTIPGMAAVFGILPTILTIGMILGLCILMMVLSLRQRSHLGRMVGLGCGLAILLQTVLAVASTLAWIPSVGVQLPIVSYGGTSLLITGLLIGLAMSVYRYQNIVS